MSLAAVYPETTPAARAAIELEDSLIEGVPDLESYDWILVNNSGGKDSQRALARVIALARAADFLARVIVVHADLGRVEWEGTRELAEEQAAFFGVPFVVTTREQNDLLDHVRARRMWPSSAARYCTSDHKRGPIRRVMTDLARSTRARFGRKARILNVLGMRKQESPKRAKLLPFSHDASASNGRRHVDQWLPIHELTADEVWAGIRAYGLPYHRAYSFGMPRLSCCFCILASESALLVAGQHNRSLLGEYVAVEAAIGHSFRFSGKVHLKIADIAAKVDAGMRVEGPIEGWCM